MPADRCSSAANRLAARTAWATLVSVGLPAVRVGMAPSPGGGALRQHIRHVVIRRLGENEWESWRRLRLRALAEDPEAFGSTLQRELAYSDEEWRERTRLLAHADDRVLFVASETDRLIGCAGVYTSEDGTPSVVSMWVEAAARGRGVGRALLGAVEEWARGQGKPRLTLDVVDGNERAESMYARAGFGRTGRTYPLPRDATVLMVEMEKDLDPM